MVSSAYVAKIFTNDDSDVLLQYGLSGATKTPDWTGNRTDQGQLSFTVGTYALKIELYQKSRFGSSTLWGVASVPLHDLLPGIIVKADVVKQQPTSPITIMGKLYIELSPVSLVRRINLEICKAGLRRYAASTSLHVVYEVLHHLREANLPRSVTWIDTAVVYLRAILQYIARHPSCVATNPALRDKNAVKDVIFQIECQITYFWKAYLPSVKAAGTAIPSLAEDLFPTVTKAVILIYSFINHYQACAYAVVRPLNLACHDAFYDVQLRLLILRAKMQDLYGKAHPLDISLSAFCRLVAHRSSERFSGCKLLSGRYQDLLSCIRNESMVVALLDAYKSTIDESTVRERKEGASFAGYRSAARRLMTTLARDTDLLPSNLIIKDSSLRAESQPISHGIPTQVSEQERGGYGIVRWGKMYDASSKKDVHVAIKTIIKCTSQDIKKTYIEVLVGWTLNHPRLLSTEGITRSIGGLGQISIVSRRMRGNLSDRIRARDFVSRRDEDKLKQLNRWLTQIAEGLVYMHEEGVIHGDLHGRNIFIHGGSGTNEDIVIGDFGVSVYADAYSKAFDSTRSGKANFLAPELIPPEDVTQERRLPPQALLSPGISKSLVPPMRAIRGSPTSTSTRVGIPPAAIAQLSGIPMEQISPSRRPTKQSDLFSFAMLFIELYSGEEPFARYDVATTRSKIMQGERPDMPVLVQNMQRLKTRISICWQQQPLRREDAHRLLLDLRQLPQ